MTRHEQDREDLLREATALVRRAEFRLLGEPENVVVGFRRDGCASLYWGGDEAWHWNTRGQLRRAHLDGNLLKAESGRLVSMRRERTVAETQLLRQPLTDEQSADVLRRLAARLQRLSIAFQAENVILVGQVPPDEDILSQVRDWSVSLARPAVIAHRPHAE